MKRLICLLLLVFAAGLCMPVMAEEAPRLREENEDWYFYSSSPRLHTLLENPQWYMVRGTVVKHGDYEGHEVFWFEISESIKGDLSGTIPVSYTAAKYAESGLACVIRLDGLTAPVMKLQQEYIMVVDMRCQTMFPYNLNMRPGEDGEIFREALDSTVFAFYVEDGEVHCGSPQLTEEINSMAKFDSLDDLESFFRQQTAPHSDWNVSVLCVGAVLLAGWAMLMGRALYWRKRNME